MRRQFSIDKHELKIKLSLHLLPLIRILSRNKVQGHFQFIPNLWACLLEGHLHPLVVRQQEGLKYDCQMSKDLMWPGVDKISMYWSQRTNYFITSKDRITLS